MQGNSYNCVPAYNRWWIIGRQRPQHVCYSWLQGSHILGACLSLVLVSGWGLVWFAMIAGPGSCAKEEAKPETLLAFCLRQQPALTTFDSVSDLNNWIKVWQSSCLICPANSVWDAEKNPGNSVRAPTLRLLLVGVAAMYCGLLHITDLPAMTHWQRLLNFSTYYTSRMYLRKAWMEASMLCFLLHYNSWKKSIIFSLSPFA